MQLRSDIRQQPRGFDLAKNDDEERRHFEIEFFKDRELIRNPGRYDCLQFQLSPCSARKAFLVPHKIAFYFQLIAFQLRDKQEKS